MKKYLNQVAVSISLLYMVGAIANENDNVECCDFSDEEMNASTEGLPIGPIGPTQLDDLEKASPDLHSIVTSPAWKTMDGLEKLRTASKTALQAWGMKDEDIDEHMARIDSYDSNLSDTTREGARVIFGMMGDALVNQIAFIQREKQHGEVAVDTLSPFKESHPEQMEEFKECLDKSIERIGTKSRLIFGDWIDIIETRAVSGNGNIVLAIARAYSKQQTQFKNVVLLHGTADARACFTQLEI